ncbi:MAG: molybdenum cofactor biosynthesis protein B [Candidatus Zixiibacteriota bacterium]
MGQEGRVKYSVAVIVVSDRAASGVRADRCLPVFEELLADSLFDLKSTHIVPDESDAICSALKTCIDQNCDLIMTSGGTGCTERDITPEITRTLLDKPTPGVDEAIRRFSSTKSPNAIYSRAISGIAGRSFVVNLPGSPKAVREILGFLLPTIEHPLGLVAGSITDCETESQRND